MRKVLSFVLVLSLVLGSFSMAFAATPAPTGLSDIADSANAEAIQVAYDLGIVTGNPDGTFLPGKAVTRAEFAAMITRALAIPDSALAGYTATTFKDTAGYSWAVPYLAFCNSKGIMLGDGAGNVMPGRTINTNEAVTMVLRAIGYTSNSADLVGAWPANYVTKAQDLGIYEDVAAVLSVDKANAAQLIYNALTVNKVSVNSDGQTTQVTPAANLLTAGLKCTSTVAVVDYDDPAVINITPYVGAYATKYLNDDNKIVAVKEKSTFLTGEFNAAKDTFTADDVDYKMASTQTVTTTAGLLNSDDSKLADGAIGTFAANTTYTIAADLSGKTIKGVYSVNQWVATEDEMVDSGVQDEIADQKLLNFDFALDDDDNIDTDTFALVGVSSLDKIAKDNVVYVYTYGNVNSADIVKVEVGTEVVTGIVSSFSTDDGAKIAGKYYANAAVVANGLAAKNVSDTVKVWLNADGDVYDFEVTEGNADNYAVVTGAKATSGYDKIIKLINAEAADKTYTLDKDINSVDPAKGQIVVYGLDKDGVVEAMDVTTSAVYKTDSNVVVTAGTLTVETSKVLKISSNSYRISSDVVVFTYDGVNPADAATDFDVTTIGKVDDTAIAKTCGLYFDKDGIVVAMLIPEEAADTSDDDVYAVVNGKELTVNADNEKVYQLTGFANGAALDKLTSTQAKGDLVNNAANEIVLYKFGVDANGVINAVAKEVAQADGSTGTAVTSDTGIVVKSAGAGYITASGGALGTVPLADNVKYYQVTFKDNGNVDKYSVFTGSVREGYKVWLYDTDTTDAPGYEYVIVLK